MAPTKGIDIQGILKQVNRGGKADIHKAAELLIEQKSILSSVFSEAQNVASNDVAAISNSDLFSIAQSSLKNVVMSDSNAELSETELESAIQDIETKVAEYSNKLESQERQEMGLTQDTGTKESKEAEVVKTEEVAPYDDVESEVPENVRNAVDETVERMAVELARNPYSYPTVHCDADGATVKKVYTKLLYKTNGENRGFIQFGDDPDFGGRQIKYADAVQVYVEYEYKGKIYRSKTAEREFESIVVPQNVSEIEVAPLEPEFE